VISSRRHLFALLGVVLPAVAAAPAFAATSNPIHHHSSKHHVNASHKTSKSHHHSSVHQTSHHSHHSTTHKTVSS